MTTETAASGEVGLGRGGRMSRKRKRDAVLRLLRGEDLEMLSRALGVTAATLSGWQVPCLHFLSLSSISPMRKTKILVTLGPATESQEMIERLIRTGANLIRLNMSHASHEWTRTVYGHVRRAIAL